METVVEAGEVSKAVGGFMALLARANSVFADSVLVASWKTSEPNGISTNEVVQFTWKNDFGTYGLTLTEGGIQAGQWVGDSFFCEDSDGDEVQISMYEHVVVKPDKDWIEGGDGKMGK